MGNNDCYKYTLALLNIFIFIEGGVFVVVGCLYKFSSGLLETDVITLFNKIQYEGVQLGLVGEGVAYLMMVFGGLILFMAILGACGACRANKCCLFSFAGCIVFVMLIQLLIVGLFVFYLQRTDQWLKGKMLNSLKSYAGPQATDLYSEGWNALFMKARCCGVNDQFKDGGTNSDFTGLPTTWTSGTDKVPATCCQGVTEGTVSTYLNSADCTNTPNNFYTQGCYDRVAERIFMYSLVVFITTGISIFVQITAIVLAMVVVKHSKNKVHDMPSVPRSKPPPYISGSGSSSNASSNWNTMAKAVQRHNLAKTKS